MKKILLSFVLLLAIIISGFSQVPDAFNYQAVVRNSSGDIIANQNVSFRISILVDSEFGKPVYVETHSVTTNDFGLANLKIGQGAIVSGAFSPDTWGSNLHFIKVEIDLSGGSSYTFLGTSQLLSVPYAFHAETANSSQWQNDSPDIYFNTGKVGIGKIPGTDLRQFQVKTDGFQAIAGENNSATLATIYAKNLGTGLAADFRNQIRILDGTEGAGKVLTSDTGGLSSWQTPAPGSLWTQSGSNIYYNGGNVGIGKAPSTSYLLDAYSSTTASIRLSSSLYNANLILSRGSMISQSASINYQDNGTAAFSTGILSGSIFYSIRPANTPDGGLVVEQDGDVDLINELHSANTGEANMMPFAYGYISSDGSLVGGTSNIGTVTLAATGQYKVEIAGLGDDYAVVVSANMGNSALNCVVSVRTTTLFVVTVFDVKNDVYANAGFSFIVYKP